MQEIKKVLYENIARLENEKVWLKKGEPNGSFVIVYVISRKYYIKDK